MLVNSSSKEGTSITLNDASPLSPFPSVSPPDKKIPTILITHLETKVNIVARRSSPLITKSLQSVIPSVSSAGVVLVARRERGEEARKSLPSPARPFSAWLPGGCDVYPICFQVESEKNLYEERGGGGSEGCY